MGEVEGLVVRPYLHRWAKKMLQRRNSSSDYSKLFYVVLSGAPHSGKTSIMNYLTNECFGPTVTDAERYEPTIGVNFTPLYWQHDSVSLKTLVWDLSGDPIYDHITDSYYSGFFGVVLVVDLCNKDSLKAIV